MQSKIKVLWFSNVAFDNSEPKGTGSWIHAMAASLIDAGTIQLFSITQGNVKVITRQDYESIKQWLVPFESLGKDGLPASKTVYGIERIVYDIQPDIIHIWGIENYWGLLTSRGVIKGNVILEIQGLKFVCAKYFFSGLSFKDIIGCFGIKEILKPSVSILGLKHSYEIWGKFEKEMLKTHSIISTQSDWIRSHVKCFTNHSTKILNTSISLRKEFIEARKWDIENCIPYKIFTVTSLNLSYKGLHVLIDAVAILKNRFPQIELAIAGNIQSGIRKSGYSKWIQAKIKKLKLDQNILWLGSLDAKELVLQLQQTNVAVVSSYIESYSLTFDEALTLGVPTVATFAGAMSELADHKKTALFFSPGDEIMCANAIESYFLNRDFTKLVSANAYNSKKTLRKSEVGNLQLSLYSEILQLNQ